MDTLQIERNDSCAKRFLRVFILKISYLLWSILGVMLLTPNTAPGEHWVAMFFNNPRSAEFFDSYGLHPLVYGLTDFFRFSFLILDLQLKDPTEFDI